MDLDAHTLGILGGGGLGGLVLAFVMPIANKLTDRWMKSADREADARQKIADNEAAARTNLFEVQTRTIERVADSAERSTIAMERMVDHVEQTNVRLNRIENHLGIQVQLAHPTGIEVQHVAQVRSKQVSQPNLASQQTTEKPSSKE